MVTDHDAQAIVLAPLSLSHCDLAINLSLQLQCAHGITVVIVEVSHLAALDYYIHVSCNFDPREFLFQFCFQ